MNVNANDELGEPRLIVSAGLGKMLCVKVLEPVKTLFPLTVAQDGQPIIFVPVIGDVVLIKFMT